MLIRMNNGGGLGDGMDSLSKLDSLMHRVREKASGRVQDGGGAEPAAMAQRVAPQAQQQVDFEDPLARDGFIASLQSVPKVAEVESDSSMVHHALDPEKVARLLDLA